MIKQIHLNQCDSTQDVLKEQLMKDPHSEEMIISCEHQIAGRGRGNNQWMSMPGTLCFSMNLKPHPILSFTAIEIAVIISNFFAERGNVLYLKWPNDLWSSSSKKIGGILIQVSHEKLLTGIGINIFSSEKIFGSIFEDELKEINKKIWSKEIGEYILENRIIDLTKLKESWRNKCIHLNKKVKIIDGEECIEGIFSDIGDSGEAIISNSKEVTRIYNGSLTFSNQ